MGTKRTGAGLRGMIVLALATSVLPGCKIEQILIGQWYSIVTTPVGACPSLDWQFAVNAQRAINGFLSGKGEQRIGTLSGVLNPVDSFQMTLANAAGAPTATVTGRFTSDVSTISINGAGAGSGCDGQTIRMRLSGYFARAGGGGGGGG
jgi:hypothetical protein